MPVTISARKIFWILTGISLCLLSIHLAFVYLNTTFELTSYTKMAIDRFNMDAEVSIPTWFEQTLFLAGSLFSAMLALAQKAKEDKKAWLGISGIMLYLSIDESSAIHELIAEPVRNTLNIISGPFIFAWTIPVLILIIILTLLYFQFFLRLEKRTRLLLILSGLVFVGGAAGFEIISGAYWSYKNFAFDAFYSILTGLEEIFELLGLSMFIYAVLDALSNTQQSSIPTIQFKK